MKKEYIVPTFEIFELCPENMIANSFDQGGDGEEFNPDEGDIELSNKRQPIGGTWNSDNWNQVEE